MEKENPTLKEYLFPILGANLYFNRVKNSNTNYDLYLGMAHATITIVLGAGIVSIAKGLEALLK